MVIRFALLRFLLGRRLSSPAGLTAALGAGLATGLLKGRPGPAVDRRSRRWLHRLMRLAKPVLASLVTGSLLSSRSSATAADKDSKQTSDPS